MSNFGVVLQIVNIVGDQLAKVELNSEKVDPWDWVPVGVAWDCFEVMDLP